MRLVWANLSSWMSCAHVMLARPICGIFPCSRTESIPGPAAVTQAELVKMLEAELGRPVKVMAAGAMMARLIGLFDKDMAELVEMIYEWTDPFVMDSSKAEKAFGWKGTPLNQALKETVEWCRSHPEKIISSADLVPVKADD